MFQCLTYVVSFIFWIILIIIKLFLSCYLFCCYRSRYTPRGEPVNQHWLASESATLHFLARRDSEHLWPHRSENWIQWNCLQCKALLSLVPSFWLTLLLFSYFLYVIYSLLRSGSFTCPFYALSLLKSTVLLEPTTVGLSGLIIQHKYL